jgi:hypothetical protein
MRYAARRDLNDLQISEAAKRAGFEVIDFGRAGESIPDKLAVKPLPDGTIFVCWLEIKSKLGKLSDGQKAFKAIWEPRGEWIEARDPVDTIERLCKFYDLKLGPAHKR